MEVYDASESNSPRQRPERRGISRTTVIGKAKEKVGILEAAERFCGKGVRRGRETFFCCCLHKDHRPSLRVNPEKGFWFCDPCLVGGDVVELARHALGYSKAEVATAAAMLLMEFGHEVPQRPPSWFRRHERQAPVRDAFEQAEMRRVQRRLYRWLFAPAIAGFEDEDERRDEERIGWEDCEKLARLVVHQAGGQDI